VPVSFLTAHGHFSLYVANGKTISFWTKFDFIVDMCGRLKKFFYAKKDTSQNYEICLFYVYLEDASITRLGFSFDVDRSAEL